MFLKDNILPIVGMNKDDDPRYFEQGEYVEARNAEITGTADQGERNIVRSIKSGQVYTLPSTGGSELEHQHLAVAKDIENDREYILSLVNFGAGQDDWYFVIYKHDVSVNTYKIILQQIASDWGLYPYSTYNQKIFNPRIVNDNLVWTDNYNDIRMINVDRIEETTDAGLTGSAVLWDNNTASSPGYSVGDYVWYKDRLYEVIQATSSSTNPVYAPTYYKDKADVQDVYLDVSTPDNFVLVALPPLISPTVDYVPDSDRNVNQLRGNTWQFSYRYIYMDYRRSTYAPPSLVPPPDKEETKTGEPNPDITHNNRIQVKINTGNEEVRSIEVIARSSKDPSTWYLVKEVLVVTAKGDRVYPSNEEINVNFYNDSATSVVDIIKVYTPFSYVPVRAKHMELLEGNRLAFANVTEGYTRIASNVIVDLSYESLAGITTQQTNYSWNSVSKPSHIDAALDWKLKFTLPSTNPGACTFYVKVNRNDEAGFGLASYDYNGTDAYPSAVKIGILAAIEVTWPGETTPCFSSGFAGPGYTFCAFPITQDDDLPDPYIGWPVLAYYEQSVVTEVNKHPQLKTGTVQSWGIIYRDKAGRISPVVGSGEIHKYIPFVTENNESNIGVRPLVSFNIYHTPPDWAESYEIVYAGNKSIAWHLHLVGINYCYGKRDHDNPDSVLDDRYYRLRINACQLKTRDHLNGWSVEDYSWQKGDRIRIIGKHEFSAVEEIDGAIWDSEIAAVYTDTDWANDIGESDDDNEEFLGEWIYFRRNPNILLTPSQGSSPNKWQDNLFVEIYRPAKTGTGLYYTTGMTYSIGIDDESNRKYHKGDTDQDLSPSGATTTPAIVHNTAHDVWKYIRNFAVYGSYDSVDGIVNYVTLEIWSESEYSSDFYVTEKMTSQGNPIPDVEGQQENVLTKRARHGGIIGIGSQINNLADFEYDDYKDFKDEHGPIEGIRGVGFVLKVAQQSKVTSIYISRQESFTASGGSQYLFTDKVFGSVRPSMENWGTKHPESICVHNQHLYFWDQREGIIVRDAANGQVAISDNKMKSYFADLAETMRSYSIADQKVEFVFNSRSNELFCMFGGSSSAKEIVIFSENNQRWKRFIDVTLNRSKHYIFGVRMFTVNGNNVIEWNKGADYNVVAGSTVRPEIVVYSRNEFTKPKVFNSIIVYSTITERRFEFVEVSVPALATAGEGAMVTNIYNININRRESAYYCQILRDVNTPGPGTQAEKEMNGRWLRGLYCKIHIRNTTVAANDKFELTNLIAVSTPSERSS